MISLNPRLHGTRRPDQFVGASGFDAAAPAESSFNHTATDLTV